MQISGFEKLTLTDFPGQVACVLFTQGCNLRCPFCQNSDLLLPNKATIITEEEIWQYLEKRKHILDGVVISGGEPLLQKELPDFLQKIKALGLKVKLDTNGTNPALLQKLLADHLIDYVAMDIKHDLLQYGTITGVAKLQTDLIQASIDLLKQSAIDYEFRTTLVKEYHDIEAIQNICALIGTDSKYYLQNYQDSDRVLKEGLHGFAEEELQFFYTRFKPEYPLIQVRGI